MSNSITDMPIEKEEMPVEQKKALNPTINSTPKPLHLALVLFAIAFLLFSNTFQHGFVLDDIGIIKTNKITEASVGFENAKVIFSTPHLSGAYHDQENVIYRPFTKLLFNIEWNLFDGDPHLFHILQALLYGCIGVLLFFILLEAFHKKWVVAFLVSLLFIVHPIHTEVVDNIKCADELLSLLGILLALRCIQQYIKKDVAFYFVLAILSLLMALFSKESAVTALALVPLFLYFLLDIPVKKNILITASSAACVLFFLWCRWNVLHVYPEPRAIMASDNYLVLCKEAAFANTSQIASAVSTFGLYLKTFFLPYALSSDYSYSTIQPVGFADVGFLVVMIICISLLFYTVKQWQQKSVIGFGFLWLIISMSITSNVFFLIGTSFGERLFFIPSLGICLALVYALYEKLDKEKIETSFAETMQKAPQLFAIVFVLAGLYSFKTWTRNKDWVSDIILLSKDIETSPNSCHLLYNLGIKLSGGERKQELANELISLGYSQQQIEDSSAVENQKSFAYLSKALSIYPYMPPEGYNEIGLNYFNRGQLDSAYSFYHEANIRDTSNPIFINNIGTVYLNKANALKQSNLEEANKLYAIAFSYFVNATSKDTSESDYMNNIGCIYGNANRLDSALFWFKKASEHDSLDVVSLQYLSMTYQNIGDTLQAVYYQQRANAIRNQGMQ